MKHDILVNNVSNIRKKTADYSDEEIEFIFDTNLRSALRLSRLMYPMLKQGTNSSIVNISSVAGPASSQDRERYGMTKAAMVQLTGTWQASGLLTV
ncbi:MAG: SDR family NAD(P)-dependent oxidoreductase [Bacteroidales bacterium]